MSQARTNEEQEAIARAYAHMDEVNEAHSRGQETAAEKRLRDAKEGRVEGSGAETQPRRGPRRPKPSAAARAWLDRQDRDRARTSVTLTLPAEALGRYRAVQRLGGNPRTKPADVGRREAVADRSIDVQVWTWVRSTPGYAAWVRGPEWMDDAEFSSRVEAWLPRTFRSPLPDLCEAEAEEQARGRAEVEEALRREDGGRIMPGMVRTEEP